MKYCRLILLISCFPFVSDSFGQRIPVLEPTKIGSEFDFSEEFISKFNSAEAFHACEDVYQKINADGRTLEEATSKELEILKYCDETRSVVWNPVGDACSWYCGGAVEKIEASSFLKSQGDISYKPFNAHDFSYRNAWIEGADDYGVGEFLVYQFRSENPRITEIIIANGYVKNQQAWTDNSRVKLLRVYFNNEPLFDLSLRDVRAEQRFKVDPIGHQDRSDFEALKNMEPWSLKFEILEVYKGAKYADTAISEIYFDGIDVH